MKNNFTRLTLRFNITILIISLFTCLASQAQTEVKITLSGFTQDVIADPVLNTNPNSVTTYSIDDPPGYVFFAQGYSSGSPAFANGLPANGQITSSAGHNFQLGPINGNNDLRLNKNETGTLIFNISDQNAYDSLFILGTAGNGNTIVNYTVHFSDLSLFTGSFIFPDWFCNSCTQFAINGLDRVKLSTQLANENPYFNIYENKITLSGGNQSKAIDSISFNVPNNQGIANIFGITGYHTTPLPVILENFTVTPDNGKALLQWKTSQELNNSKYIIRRASGINPAVFSNIGEVEATSSDTGSSYSFVDNPGVSGTYFYQLLQEDIDGNIQNLGTRSITFNNNATWVVQNIGSQWRLICAQPFMYRLLDLQGRVIIAATGSGSATINKPDAYGIYELQVQTNGVFSTRKLLK
jgi:hypothetical protein